MNTISPSKPSPEKNIRKLRSHQQLSTISRTAKPPVSAAWRQTQPKTTDAIPTRNRANSEAPVPLLQTARPGTRIDSLKDNASAHARKPSLEVALKDGPPPGTKASAALGGIRHSILTTGVQATREGMSDSRIYLWLVLLNVPPLPTDVYLSKIHRGRSPAHEKIANDVFRTLATDTLFKRRVTDASLTRVLNATAWRIHDEQKVIPAGTSVAQSSYIQGMNVLLAPLLYAARSEAQAYGLLSTILTSHIPTYLTPTMSGVHAGLELIDKILAKIQPNLSQFLLANSLPAKVYAFAPVLTLCACTPPLPEVLKLWDFLFAFGTHLNVLCVVAQVVVIKDKLMESSSPGKLLRSFPNLKASDIIATTLVVMRELPEDIYSEVVRHGRI